ncbi:MAG: DUF92 domain-containing protein [Thermomicrobiales bacterium]
MLSTLHRPGVRAALGLGGATAFAATGLRTKSLSRSGAIAATLVGTAVVAGGGYRAGAALITFFATSSLLGRLPARAGVSAQRRGNERDAMQVLANGGVATLLSLASLAAPPQVRAQVKVALIGSVATAAADTWATEIGSRYGHRPRAITTLRLVPAGTSGAISVAGLTASAGGAIMIAAVGVPNGFGFRGAAIGGIAGAVVDSVFGATWQEVRWCPACRQETELPRHDCGTETLHRRGLAWCTNDTVNLMSIAAGALIASAMSVRDPDKKTNHRRLKPTIAPLTRTTRRSGRNLSGI